MDESVFVVDPAGLAEAARKFPAHRRVSLTSGDRPAEDLSYLAAPHAEFARQAWDEGGHS